MTPLRPKAKILFVCLLLSQFIVAQQTKSWTSNPFEQKVFVENKGQFDKVDADAKILYSARSKGVDFYFTTEGIIYKLDKAVALSKEEKEAFDKNKQKPKKEKKEEKGIEPFNLVPEFLNMKWLNANPEVQIIAEEKQKGYYTYGYNTGGKITNIVANTFTKITYKN